MRYYFTLEYWCLGMGPRGAGVASLDAVALPDATELVVDPGRLPPLNFSPSRFSLVLSVESLFLFLSIELEQKSNQRCEQLLHMIMIYCEILEPRKPIR